MVNKSITSIIAQIVYVDCLHNGFANISLILLTVINCYMALTYSICPAQSNLVILHSMAMCRLYSPHSWVL